MPEPALSAATGTVPVGWFGKLPRAGDYLSRDLPASFTRPLTDWLNLAVGAAQDALGEDFQRIYLTAPIWRFSFAADMLGDRSWRGVLMASCDRVGRFFPFVIAAEAPAGSWLDDAEQAARALIDDDTPLEIGPMEVPSEAGEDSGCAFWLAPEGTRAHSAALPSGDASAALFTQDWAGAGWRETESGMWRWT